MKTPDEIAREYADYLAPCEIDRDSALYLETVEELAEDIKELIKAREQQAVDDKLQTICDYLTEHNPMPIVPDLNVSWINMFGVQWSTEDLAYIVKPKTTE